MGKLLLTLVLVTNGCSHKKPTPIVPIQPPSLIDIWRMGQLERQCEDTTFGPRRQRCELRSTGVI